jgi:hypothetical protein
MWKFNHFVVGIGINFSTWQWRRQWTNSICLFRLEKNIYYYWYIIRLCLKHATNDLFSYHPIRHLSLPRLIGWHFVISLYRSVWHCEKKKNKNNGEKHFYLWTLADDKWIKRRNIFYINKSRKRDRTRRWCEMNSCIMYEEICFSERWKIMFYCHFWGNMLLCYLSSLRNK